MDLVRLTGLGKGRDKQGNSYLSGNLNAIILVVVSFLMLSLLEGCTSWFSFQSARSRAKIKRQRFSHENVMRIHQGMTPEEIIAIFGKPDEIKRTPRKGLCYLYKVPFGPGHWSFNNFTFASEPEPRLVYWSVNVPWGLKKKRKHNARDTEDDLFE